MVTIHKGVLVWLYLIDYIIFVNKELSAEIMRGLESAPHARFPCIVLHSKYILSCCGVNTSYLAHQLFINNILFVS